MLNEPIHAVHTVTKIAGDDLTAIDLRELYANLSADRCAPVAYVATVHRVDDPDERPLAEGIQMVVCFHTGDAWVAWGADSQHVEDVDGPDVPRTAVERFLAGDTR